MYAKNFNMQQPVMDSKKDEKKRKTYDKRETTTTTTLFHQTHYLLFEFQYGEQNKIN